MTRRLILMRHAKSSWDDAALDDFDRPLNARGHRSAAALGLWLANKGLLPDRVLCSPSRRTLQTLDGLHLGALPVDTPEALYHAPAHVLLDTLHAQASGATVLMIAHNPGCAGFAARMLATPPGHPRFHDFPTGATLVIDLPIENWSEAEFRTGELIDFTVPRELTD